MAHKNQAPLCRDHTLTNMESVSISCGISLTGAIGAKTGVEAAEPADVTHVDTDVFNGCSQGDLADTAPPKRYGVSVIMGHCDKIEPV